jgi:hypothetical protein
MNTLEEKPVPDDKEPPLKKGNQEEKNRMILVCGVLLLTLVTLILYAITRDNALLLASGTVSGTVGTCILLVFRYYFEKK